MKSSRAFIAVIPLSVALLLAGCKPDNSAVMPSKPTTRPAAGGLKTQGVSNEGSGSAPAGGASSAGQAPSPKAGEKVLEPLPVE